MAQPRISDPPASSERPKSVERFVSRLSEGIASPVGILLIIPGLVSLVGTFLTLLGEYALHDSSIEVAQGRMAEQARLVATSVRDALGQSEPMLDRLEDLTLHHHPAQPFEGFAHALKDLMDGRFGVTYVSASFPDGTFQGAYVDPDGVTRFQDSRVGAQGTFARRFDYGSRGLLLPQREDQTEYDPRVRGFYLLATETGKRVWTKPYLFYDSQTAGVTRAAPIYTTRDGARTLHAVVTIDFDVNALSSYLSARKLEGMRSLLYADDGTILAYAAEADAPLTLIAHDQRPLRFQDLSDPLLLAFFAVARQDRQARERVRSVFVGERRYLSAMARVSSEPSLPWSTAYLVPEQQFLKVLSAYEDRSFWIGGVAVLASTLIAYLFARHITRVRTEAREAKEEAREARAAAREARAEARELGSYRLVACLGRGGMGEVWRAQHRLLAREAAIKLIKPDELSNISEAMRERFRREAEALARLRSRNTIELFDYGVAEDGTFFLVMELLDGLDFDTLVQKHGAQPPERVVHLLIQVCNSLAEAHSAGLVHRDIKPANLFMCRAAEEVDVVKVLDFGLVRGAKEAGAEHALLPLTDLRVGGLTQPEGLVGTPAYMAPEQVQSRPIDGRADLYALGGVAFWLLTGELVFDVENPVEQLLAQIHEPLPDLRKRLPRETPAELVQLITACLAKDAIDRPSDARALGRLLRAVPFTAARTWTDERAQAWWLAHRPQPSEYPPLVEPRELNVASALTITKEG
jgi:serine/threonine protein kinase